MGLGLPGVGKFHSFKLEMPEDDGAKRARQQKKLEQDLAHYGTESPRGKDALAALTRMNETPDSPVRHPWLRPVSNHSRLAGEDALVDVPRPQPFGGLPAFLQGERKSIGTVR